MFKNKKVYLCIRNTASCLLLLFVSQTILFSTRANAAGIKSADMKWVSGTAIEVSNINVPGGYSIEGINVNAKAGEGKYLSDGSNGACVFLKRDFDLQDIDCSQVRAFGMQKDGCTNFVLAAADNAMLIQNPNVPTKGCASKILEKDTYRKNFVYVGDIGNGEAANVVFTHNTDNDTLRTSFIDEDFKYSGSSGIYLRPSEEGDTCQDYILLTGKTAELFEMAKRGIKDLERESVPGHPDCMWVRNVKGDVFSGSTEEVNKIIQESGGKTDSDPENNNAKCMQNANGYGLAWIMCPVYNAAQSAMNTMLKWIRNIMYTKIGEDSTAIKDAWAGLRNVANGVFVVALLLILIGQALKGSW